MFFGSFDVFYECLKKCFYKSVKNMFLMFLTSGDDCTMFSLAFTCDV